MSLHSLVEIFIYQSVENCRGFIIHRALPVSGVKMQLKILDKVFIAAGACCSRNVIAVGLEFGFYRRLVRRSVLSKIVAKLLFGRIIKLGAYARLVQLSPGKRRAGIEFAAGGNITMADHLGGGDIRIALQDRLR